MESERSPLLMKATISLICSAVFVMRSRHSDERLKPPHRNEVRVEPESLTVAAFAVTHGYAPSLAASQLRSNDAPAMVAPAAYRLLLNSRSGHDAVRVHSFRVLSLPRFRYHSDPLRTGSVITTNDRCKCCRRVRRFIYTVGTPACPPRTVCPWCIADGKAAQRFDTEFNDVDWGVPAGVPASALDELRFRTPSFTGWQHAHWLYHCGDACDFLGMFGYADLQGTEPMMSAVVEAVAAYGWPDDRVRSFVERLDPAEQPTAYLFRCLVCDAYRAYCDWA